jgi:hypothetical protein
VYCLEPGRLSSIIFASSRPMGKPSASKALFGFFERAPALPQGKCAETAHALPRALRAFGISE